MLLIVVILFTLFAGRVKVCYVANNCNVILLLMTRPTTDCVTDILKTKNVTE